MGQQLYSKNPERLSRYQSVQVKLAILKFDNCATADQVVKELQDQNDEKIKSSAILSRLTSLVAKGFVMRIEDPPENDAGEPEVFYILTESGFESAKSAIWMIDNMHPSEIVYLLD